MHILSSNSKLEKCLKLGYLSEGIQLKPSEVICQWHDTCIHHCLYKAGNGEIPKVQRAREERTDFFLKYPDAFIYLLVNRDFPAGKKVAEKSGLKYAVRLATINDWPWYQMPEVINLMNDNPDTQFYDYTANPNLAKDYLAGKLPPNYHITFSRKATNEKMARAFLKKGMSIAVVFRNKHLPKTFWGAPVVNGDEHDLTFLHPAGSVIGLKAKHTARSDKSGFVVDI